MRRLILRFRAINRNIFEAIKDGNKKIETRAATPKYSKIKTGDELTFICGKSRFTKKVKTVGIFRNIDQLIKNYRIKDINPFCKNKLELIKMYYSFPGYREKIKKFGLI